MSRIQQNEIPPLKFRVKGWISRDDFLRLLKFSDYLGREEGESIFKINPEKAAKNDIELEDILSIFRELGDHIYDATIKALEESANEKKKAYLLMENGKIILRTRVFLGSKLRELGKYIRYDRKKRTFMVYPGLIGEFIQKAREIGINVEDRTGLPQAIPIEEKLSFTGTLRDYQEEALEKWKLNRYRGIIALPTGSGKTVIGVAAISVLSERTLVIAYTKEQLKQWIDQILRYTDIPRSYVASFYSEEKRLAPITVTTYQTAYRHIAELAFRYSFVIVDEVHHLPAEKFKTIALGLYAPHRMGLSATVVREDGKHTELFPLMGGIVYHKTPQEMIEKGYLAPYSTFLVKVSLTPEEKKEYEKFRSIYKALSMGLSFKEVLRRAQNGDPRMGKALSIHSSMQQVFQKAKAKEKAVKEIVEKELEKGSKILIFTQYVDQARKLGELLEAPVITGDTETRKRFRILDEFRKAEKGVLILTTVGDEGLDIPDVNVGIIVAGTGSRRQFIQRLGRLLRPKPGKKARLYEIIVKGTAEEAQARKRKKIEGERKESKQRRLF